MNNKGITMVTVVVMIIVMLIIATVSIVAGNKAILEAKEYKLEQELQSVKAAVSRKKTEVNLSGSLIPIGEAYVGIKDPVLKSTGAETIVATDWYLLDRENLEKLGVYETDIRYIVNYDYELVLSTQDSNYIEEYMVSEFMIDHIANSTVAGVKLKNKITDSTAKMVRNIKTGDVFGEGWYLLKQSATGTEGFDEKYKSNIKHDYLINYDTAKYVRMDSNFEEI